MLKLLGQVELLSPEEHLQMFNSPLNISMDFGKKRSQTFHLGCRYLVLGGCSPAGVSVIPDRSFHQGQREVFFSPGRTENQVGLGPLDLGSGLCVLNGPP